jgi:hypothetical protein
VELNDKLAEGEEGLKRYLAAPPILHGGFGVLVVACSSDEQLVIRMRSEACADYLDANKWAVSANEGLRADHDVNKDGTFKPCLQIVARALQNELLGYEGRGPEVVDKMECHLTGVLLYLPNLTVNLCFLVHLGATLNEIMELAKGAPHAHEFKITKGEPFTREAICSFVASTRDFGDEQSSIYAKSWCEGSLVPFYFALRVKETQPK